jgi:hypothetical protein
LFWNRRIAYATFSSKYAQYRAFRAAALYDNGTGLVRYRFARRVVGARK